jgi:hypothetical protein
MTKPNVVKFCEVGTYMTLKDILSREPTQYPWEEIPRELVICLNDMILEADMLLVNQKTKRIPHKPDLWNELSKFCFKNNPDCPFRIPSRPKTRTSEGVHLVALPSSHLMGCKFYHLGSFRQSDAEVMPGPVKDHIIGIHAVEAEHRDRLRRIDYQDSKNTVISAGVQETSLPSYKSYLSFFVDVVTTQKLLGVHSIKDSGLNNWYTAKDTQLWISTVMAGDRLRYLQSFFRHKTLIDQTSLNTPQQSQPEQCFQGGIEISLMGSKEYRYIFIPGDPQFVCFLVDLSEQSITLVY